MKKRIWHFFEIAQEGDEWGHIFDVSLVILIIANVFAVVIESLPSIGSTYQNEFYWFEVFSVVIFTVEYLGRIWACTVDEKFHGMLKGRWRFFWRPMNLIDLAAFLPFYLPFIGLDGRMLRILRLLRILRIAKLGKYFCAFQLMSRVIRDKKEELVITTAIMGFVLILSAATIYQFENAVQPEVFSSIPAAMWWAVITLTTVGYGDIYPITLGGKIAAAVIAVTSVGFIALPTGILGAGFVEEISKQKDNTSLKCPFCGKSISEERT